MSARLAPGRVRHIAKMAEDYANELRRSGTRRVDVRTEGETIYIDGAGYRISQVKAMTRELQARHQRGYAAR